jgi:penicillin-binding protein 1A
MNSSLQSGATFAAKHLRRFWDAARRHPVRAVLALPAMLLLYVLALYPFTPGISELKKAKSETPSRVLSFDGVVLAQFKRINREWVPLEKISPHVVNALIATEDHRFYEHHGIDVRRTVAALLSTVSGDLQGGSTITQQLARNLYPEQIGRSVRINRKAKEVITALKIEAAYSKREILETYLNTVPFLYNAFGIEMAARTYFDKSADKLNVLEAATLIGMLRTLSGRARGATWC